MPESGPPKEPAPDPEIPDAIKARLARKKRPPGYVAKTDELDTPPEEAEETSPARDLTEFFEQLGVAIKTVPCFKLISETKDVRRKIPGSKATEWVREVREIKVAVEIRAGEDGLPYPVEPVQGKESQRVKALSYPAAPKMDPVLGDLAPEFVEWLFLHHPYDASVRYAGRNTHVQIAALDRRMA